LKHSKTYLVTYHAAREILSLLGVNVNAYKYLEPARKKRHAASFEEKFDKVERDLLLYALASPRTVQDFAKKLRVSKAKAYKLVKELKRKNALEEAGILNKQKLWKATEHVKRLTVKV